MRKKKSCLMAPLVDGKASESFIQLDSLIGSKNRPITALIYAMAAQEEFKQDMDAAGYKRNSQNEFSGKDIKRYLKNTAFDINKMVKTVNTSEVVGRDTGVIDNYGNYVDFTDADIALSKAQEVDNKVGFTAKIVVQGNKFNVIPVEYNALSVQQRAILKKQVANWRLLKSAFESVGVDITSNTIDKGLVNPTNIDGITQFLQLAQRSSTLAKGDIRNLIALNNNEAIRANSRGVRENYLNKLLRVFSDIDSVIDAMYDWQVHSDRYPSTSSTIETVFNILKQFRGLDVDELVRKVNSNDVAEYEENLHRDIQELHRKYNALLKISEIGNHLKTFDHVLQRAAHSLNTDMRKIREEFGVTEDVAALQKEINDLLKEIGSNQETTVLVNFLNKGLTKLTNIVESMRLINIDSKDFESLSNLANWITTYNAIIAEYRSTIEAILNTDKVLTNTNLSDEQKTQLKNIATQIRDKYDGTKDYVRELGLQVAYELMDLQLGFSKTGIGAKINIASFIEASDSVMDYLYSMSQATNPMHAAVGGFIRDAQHKRDAVANYYYNRVRALTREYAKESGTEDTSFMYDENGFIISDIDWNKYYRERGKEYGRLKRAGLKGIDLSLEMQVWEDENKEDVVVDYKTGRTEKLPNENYRKEFPLLTYAQRKYYNEIMQIKGELGSMLPNYAQKQFLPPQKRRNFTDAVLAAIKTGDWRTGLKALRNKGESLLGKIWEDNDEFARNGIIIDGEEYALAAMETGGTPLQRIPIFYINKLKDQGELLKDFSGAMHLLISTATNYAAMTEVKNVVDFFNELAHTGKALAKDNHRRSSVNRIKDDMTYYVLKLINRNYRQNCSNLLDGWISYHMYGKKHAKESRWVGIASNVKMYKSMQSLTFNVKGMINNFTVGKVQELIESIGGEFYDFKDFLWLTFYRSPFQVITNRPIKTYDALTNQLTSKESLLMQMFNPTQESFSKQKHYRYYGILRRILSVDLSFIGYGAGEYMLRLGGMLMTLHHIKVRKSNGKMTNLLDLFKKVKNADGYYELDWDRNAEYEYTHIDEGGNKQRATRKVDDSFIEWVSNRIKTANQECHGNMNEEDKGLIHTWILGSYMMNLRQWMVRHYSRRFRKPYWDANTKELREGYYHTFARQLPQAAGAAIKNALFFVPGHTKMGDFVDRALASVIQELYSEVAEFGQETVLRWDSMTDAQRANVRKAWAEISIVIALSMLNLALGAPSDHKKEYWYRMLQYQVKRTLNDEVASTPVGIFTEGKKVIQNPLPPVSAWSDLLYPITGIGDAFEVVGKGRHRLENKYWHRIKHRVFIFNPDYRHIEETLYFDEDNAPFLILDRKDL